jgi:glycosyltransferase involved in cell wall biosynthesis
MMLAQHGWDIHLIVGGHADKKSLRTNGYVKRRHLPLDRKPNLPRDLLAFCQALAVISSIKPDLIVAGTPKASLIFLSAARMLRIPHRVYFLLGLRLETTSGLRLRFLWAAEKLTVMASTRVLSVSRSLSSAYVRRKLCSEPKLSVVGAGSSKGVNLKLFRPAAPVEAGSLLRFAEKLGLTAGVPVVGYFGRIHPDKGIDILAASRAILLERGIDHQLLVVGQDEGCIDVLVQTDPALRPPLIVERVDDLSVYYRLLTVLCLPTLREGLPNVCLEASASSVPVVTTNATGAVNAVEHGITGLIVPQGSATALADALETLIVGRQTREAMGRVSRQWVSDRFDEATVLKQYVEYFIDLVGDVTPADGR